MDVPALASQITAVTVYHTGARVERAAPLPPPPGEYPDSVRIPGLPLSLDDRTVRLRIETDPAGAAAPVAATDLRVGLELPAPEPGLAPPRDEELRAAMHKVRRLEAHVAQVEGMGARLEKLEPPQRPRGAYGSPPPPSPGAARLALLDFRGSRLEALGEEIRTLKRELHQAREELRQLEFRHRSASTARQAREHELRKSIIVRLRRMPEGPAVACRLIVQYLVPGARWAPGYTLRFDPDYRHAQLAMRALVCQASGEDWNDVDLTVSTAEPQRWMELPELASLRIGRLQAAPARTGWREPPADTAQLFADYDRARERIAAPPPASTEPEAELEVEPEVELFDEEVEEALMMFDGASEPEIASEPEAVLAEETTAEFDDRLMLGAVAASPAPPMAAAALTPSSRPAGRKALHVKRLQTRGAPEKPPGPEAAGEIRAPDELLDYGNLRLGGIDDPVRGKLRAARPDQTCLELLASVHVEVQFDVLVAIQTARQTAARIGRSEPPPTYAFPAAWQDFDHAYAAEAQVDVASDGTFHSVPLLARTAETELRHVVVPRESPDVFRFVTLTNPLPRPLPQGPADIYVGGDFLLSSTLRTVAPGGTAELGLGVEEAIKVARNTTFAESSGLLGGRLGLEHAIRIDVANLLPETARVEVRERVPITRDGDEAVKVAVTEGEPPWESFQQTHNPIEGGYRWLVELEAGDTRTLQARYTIQFAAKHELVGGNRREP
ncbi:MAG: DUF4139 domain-containing protein [bacterium]|nr:DUF4139 domain-containing protein [bacterium]